MEMHTRNANWNLSEPVVMCVMSLILLLCMVELCSESGCYTWMEVMVMTDNFGKKIEENRFGTMYHGKLRTGQEVAVRVWAQISHLPLRLHSAAEEFHQFEMVRSPVSSSTNRV